MIYQHVISELRRSHLAELEIATDISDRTQSENDEGNDDDRYQDCCEVAKDAHGTPSVFSGSLPHSVESTTLSRLMGLGRAYLPAASMASSMCAHDGRSPPSVTIRAVPLMGRVPVTRYEPVAVDPMSTQPLPPAFDLRRDLTPHRAADATLSPPLSSARRGGWSCSPSSTCRAKLLDVPVGSATILLAGLVWHPVDSASPGHAASPGAASPPSPRAFARRPVKRCSED